MTEFNRFKKRKKPNYKRAIILLLILLAIVYLWFNAESIIAQFFNKN